MKKHLIRKAVMKDVKPIYEIISHYSKKNEMLPRSYNELYENLQSFFVAESKKKVAGCCALYISWEDLAEIKSLAVNENSKEYGIGSALVNACIKQAKGLGIKRVFCLTYVPKFFMRFGFKKTPRRSLPHKVWGECVKCPHFPDCGEVPMIKDI